MTSRKYCTPAYTTLLSLSCIIASSESTVPIFKRAALNASVANKHSDILWEILTYQC